LENDTVNRLKAWIRTWMPVSKTAHDRALAAVVQQYDEELKNKQMEMAVFRAAFVKASEEREKQKMREMDEIIEKLFPLTFHRHQIDPRQFIITARFNISDFLRMENARVEMAMIAKSVARSVEMKIANAHFIHEADRNEVVR